MRHMSRPKPGVAELLDLAPARFDVADDHRVLLLDGLVGLDRVDLVAEHLTVHQPDDRVGVVGVEVDQHLVGVGRAPGAALAGADVAPDQVRPDRAGTENTFGAAFTYHMAASAARLAIASSTVSVQCTNVNTRAGR